MLFGRSSELVTSWVMPAELEEHLVGEDEDGGGGSVDEFDRVDLSEGVNGMHDKDIF